MLSGKTLLCCFQKNAVAMCSTESWVNDVTDRKSYLPTELMGKEVRHWQSWIFYRPCIYIHSLKPVVSLASHIVTHIRLTSNTLYPLGDKRFETNGCLKRVRTNLGFLIVPNSTSAHFFKQSNLKQEKSLWYGRMNSEKKQISMEY